MSGLFVDPEKMKEKLREQLLKPRYSVADFYHEEGCFQRITKDPLFDNTTLVMIAFNAVWLWIDTDYNDAALISDAKAPFVIVENFFCVFFSVELIVRFLAFQHKRNCLQDYWFIFDTFLVTLMVFETWMMVGIVMIFSSGGGPGISNLSMLRMFRLLRLSRMARMAKLLRAMPELLILIKGMAAATRSVFFVCVLLLLLLYIFAIAIVQLSKDTEAGNELFPMVPKAMLVLLCQGALMDEFSEIIYTLEKQSPVSMVCFLVFMLLAALTIMNMLIGVLCDMITTVSTSEKDQMQVAWVKEMLEDKFDSLDENNDNLISKKEFEHLPDHPDAVMALYKIGVDVIGLVDVVDCIFDGEDSKLSFPDFLDLLLEMRGSNMATVKDVLALKKTLKTGFAEFALQLPGLVDTAMRQQGNAEFALLRTI